MTLQTGMGWMPNVDQQLSPNIKKGRDGHLVEATCIHIMVGRYQGSIDWLCNPESGVSAHFAVSWEGKITQMVNIFDTAYANGLSWDKKRKTWIDPGGNAVDPSWKRLTPPVNPNFQTVSIEHEGYQNQVWNDAMYEADRRILVYVQSHFPIIYVPHDTIIGHNEISPKLRPFCPGNGVDFAKLAGLVQKPTEDAVLWSTRWGNKVHYFSDSGIARAWRDAWRLGNELGEARTDEYDIDGGVARSFHRGYITWSERRGTTVRLYE